jgi:hypothetical protein
MAHLSQGKWYHEDQYCFTQSCAWRSAVFTTFYLSPTLPGMASHGHSHGDSARGNAPEMDENTLKDIVISELFVRDGRDGELMPKPALRCAGDENDGNGSCSLAGLVGFVWAPLLRAHGFPGHLYVDEHKESGVMFGEGKRRLARGFENAGLAEQLEAMPHLAYIHPHLNPHLSQDIWAAYWERESVCSLGASHAAAMCVPFLVTPAEVVRFVTSNEFTTTMTTVLTMGNRLSRETQRGLTMPSACMGCAAPWEFDELHPNFALRHHGMMASSFVVGSDPGVAHQILTMLEVILAIIHAGTRYPDRTTPLPLFAENVQPPGDTSWGDAANLVMATLLEIDLALPMLVGFIDNQAPNYNPRIAVTARSI